MVLNAGLATEKFEIFEDNESTINVNVVSTTLLVLLLLPILRSVAEKHHIVPVIAITCSGVHAYTKFPERNTPNSLATLNNEKTANMSDRLVLPFSVVFGANRLTVNYVNVATQSPNSSSFLQLEKLLRGPPTQTHLLSLIRSILGSATPTSPDTQRAGQL